MGFKTKSGRSFRGAELSVAAEEARGGGGVAGSGGWWREGESVGCTRIEEAEVTAMERRLRE